MPLARSASKDERKPLARSASKGEVRRWRPRDVESSEQQLMWAVQALAQPADVQPTLFPPFVVVADELALEFDHWLRVAEGGAGRAWSQAQRSVLSDLDRALSAMSGPGRPELWSEPGCLIRPEWSQIRQLAGVALAAFGWTMDRPRTAEWCMCFPSCDPGGITET